MPQGEAAWLGLHRGLPLAQGCCIWAARSLFGSDLVGLVQVPLLGREDSALASSEAAPFDALCLRLGGEPAPLPRKCCAVYLSCCLTAQGDFTKRASREAAMPSPVSLFIDCACAGCLLDLTPWLLTGRG